MLALLADDLGDWLQHTGLPIFATTMMALGFVIFVTIIAVYFLVAFAREF